MKIIVVKNYTELSALAADMIFEIISFNPSSTLGLATGSTVLGTYAHLRDRCRSGAVSFNQLTVFNLDEYVGLCASNINSYAHFMKVNLFDGTDMNLSNFHIPCGVAQDLQEECKRYDTLLGANPRDLQLLGIGSNGHIAFNEPSTPFDIRTHVVQLAQSTVDDNSRLFDSATQVPRRAITMGIGDIVDAKRIVLLASSVSKAQAVKNMVQGAVSVNCPASILQRHPDVTVILDTYAASLL